MKTNTTSCEDIVFQKVVAEKNLVTKQELDHIREAYIKVYGQRWREYFAKHYWCVYDGGETGSTGV